MSIGIYISIGMLGLLPLCIVLFKRGRNKKLKTTGISVSGVIEHLDVYIGAKGNKYYQLFINYPVYGKGILKGVEIVSKKAFKTYSKGMLVEIFYDKKKPALFILKKSPERTGLLMFTIILAIAYILIAYFLYRFLQ